jgi:outer membrane receptor protein involved in Fe transport
MNWRPVRFFSLNGGITLQNPETKSLVSVATGVPYAGLEGKKLSRIPSIMFSATPTVYFDIGGRSIELAAQVYHMGKRYVDYANATALPAYTTVDLDLLVPVTKRVTVQAHITNLTNSEGLTEGNVRVDAIGGQGTADAIYARPLFGRMFTIGANYKW